MITKKEVYEFLKTESINKKFLNDLKNYHQELEKEQLIKRKRK